MHPQGALRKVPEPRLRDGPGPSPIPAAGPAGEAGATERKPARTPPPRIGTRRPGELIIMDSVRESFRQQGLTRPRQGRVLGGVCAGLGRRFNVSPGIARLLFVLILFVLPGSQILVYPLLWFLMPDETVSYPSTAYPPGAE